MLQGGYVSRKYNHGFHLQSSSVVSCGAINEIVMMNNTINKKSKASLASSLSSKRFIIAFTTTSARAIMPLPTRTIQITFAIFEFDPTIERDLSLEEFRSSVGLWNQEVLEVPVLPSIHWEANLTMIRYTERMNIRLLKIAQDVIAIFSRLGV